MIGDSITTAILQKALDGTWQRQKAIANNIANHDTPGYKALRVSFEDTLVREIEKNNVKDAKIRVYIDNSGTERADGNNVNLDFENIEMAKAQLQYQYLIRSMTDMYSRLRYAVSEGKK
ncbi:MAG: flagellar basal body rod protein FlgB [Clostridiales bacterium]|nr:flagellar basal body rod protein FlgB [Clostridiales bacterium]